MRGFILMISEYGRQQLNIDLSMCHHWIRMMDVWYKRTETSRGEKCNYDEVTVVFLPDLIRGSPRIPAIVHMIAKKKEDSPTAVEPKKENVEETKMEEEPSKTDSTETTDKSKEESEENVASKESSDMSSKESSKKDNESTWTESSLSRMTVSSLRLLLRDLDLPIRVVDVL